MTSSTGELFYFGTGEDFEAGAGPYGFTVRASDGTRTVDAAVTVTVTDVAEAPAFAEESYAFDLAENADGSADRVSLGTVAATDPEGDALTYSLVADGEAGSGSGLFAIDTGTGELSYVGPGEDFEAGAGPFGLTVRASDGTHAVDADVTVTVTDVSEAPAFAEESYAFTVAENADGSTDRVSLGTVAASDPDGGALTYSLVAGSGVGLFAIDSSTGELFYTGAGEDFESVAGPFQLTVRASDGTHTADAAVTVNVTDESEAPVFAEAQYAFDFAENVDGSYERILLGTVAATDPDGDGLTYSLVTDDEAGSGPFAVDAATGEIFYTGTGEDFETISGAFELTVRASDGTSRADATVTVTVTNEAEAPAFADSTYAFDLAENADGSAERVLLGTVSASDPDGGGLTYSLVAGNESGLFAIDAATGELFYTGSGEDYEAGAGPFGLTVRASDGTHTADTTVTVTVTDVAEAPVFAEEAYAFDLAENADGSAERVLLGTVAATDPDGDGLTYSLVTDDEAGSGPFAIDAATGELFYTGSGEDYENVTGPFELTVRATDGTNSADATVTVTVTDVQGSSEPEDGDLPDGRATGGEVAVDEAPATGTLRSANDRDWFKVTLASGHTYVFSLQGEADGSARPRILGLRDADGNPVEGIEAGDEVRFTAGSGGTWYIVVGGADGGAAPGGTPGGGFGIRSFGALKAPDGGFGVRSQGDGGADYRLQARDVTRQARAEQVEVGEPVNGDFWYGGDIDWFAVTLEAGTTYRLDLKGASTGDGTLVWDPKIHGVYDGDGDRLPGTSNVGGGLGDNSRVLFTPETDGTFYVKVGMQYTWWTNEGTYTFSVSEVEADIAADTSTSGMVEVGGSVAGEIEARGDRDWFAVILEGGKEYRFEMVGGDVQVPEIHGIHDSDGNLVEGATVGKLSTLFLYPLQFTPEEGGTYYVSAGHRNILFPVLGEYSLSVIDVAAADDYAEDSGT
ncbi:MAG: cadherin repeat domain-containing protein, partial [Boseongicola sp. SB0673_bin_14]|nr:cadherin repeat domain-containing protein [Boseongicola sp. SB0673_bin_14]